MKQMGASLFVVLFAHGGLSIAAGSESPFEVVTTPNPNTHYRAHFNYLLGTSAASSDDIWAVGESVLHWDGNEWSAFPAPGATGDRDSLLTGVADFGPNNAWSVGWRITYPNQRTEQILNHWDGVQWTQIDNPSGVTHSGLLGMTAITDSDIWVAGCLGDLSSSQAEPLLEHFDGASWDVIDSPSLVGRILSLSANATDDVWAVGFLRDGENRTLIEHWDGFSWTIIPSANVGNGPNVLTGVAVVGPDDVWAVGYSAPDASSAAETLVEHWDGTSWTVIPSPNVPQVNPSPGNQLFGVTVAAADDIWAFGTFWVYQLSPYILNVDLMIHWDGQSWTIVPSPSPPSGSITEDSLRAGVVTSAGDVWIVGARASETLAIHRAPQ